MRMIKTRYLKILQELLAAKSPITSDFLAKKLQVSSRTVRNDMKELESILSVNGASIISVRGTGYELVIQEDSKFRSYLQDLVQTKTGYSLSSSEERISYLLRRLLLTDQFLKLDMLAEEMYVSKSTIQNDLKDVKKALQKYDVIIETRPNYGIRVKGDELKLRFCMSEYLFAPSRDPISEKVSFLDKEEFQIIRKVVLEQIKQNHIRLSDIGLNNLLIHIAIACVRIRNGNYVSILSTELKDIMDESEYEVAKKIVKQLEESLDVRFPPDEIGYITIHFIGNKVISQPNPEKNKEAMHSYIEKEIYELTTKILQAIDHKLHLGIKHDRELFLGISLHLKPAIHRHQYGMNMRNPILEEIKANYPIAFEAGVIASMVIKDEIDIDINENEIGYLALHIGAAIERLRINHDIKRCIIVCASGVGSAAFLKYKLKAEFGSKLEIVGTTEYYKIKEMSFSTIDYVISTIPIQDTLPVPVIEVGVLFGRTDIEKISTIFNFAPNQNLNFTRKELVFLQENFETKDEVLNFLVEELKSLQLVDGSFLKAVEEREAISPTCYGNLVAIPHPITPKTDTTFWAICTLQKAIDWSGRKVQFVCLLCVEKETTQDLKHMYDLLVKIVENPKKIHELLKCKTYQEFLQVFLSH